MHLGSALSTASLFCSKEADQPNLQSNTRHCRVGRISCAPPSENMPCGVVHAGRGGTMSSWNVDESTGGDRGESETAHLASTVPLSAHQPPRSWPSHTEGKEGGRLPELYWFFPAAKPREALALTGCRFSCCLVDADPCLSLWKKRLVHLLLPRRC